MRTACLVFVALLAPTAAAWSVEVRAPPSGEEAEPFSFEVCAAGEGRAQMRIMAENATLDVREDRYLPAFEGSECRRLHAMPAAGRMGIEARLRAEGGSKVLARAFANVTIHPAPPAALAIVDVHAAPHEGILLRNDGEEIALAKLRLNGDPFSNATLAPNATIFVPLDVQTGDLVLTRGAREIARIDVPKLRAGEGLFGKYGRTNVSAEPFRIEGSMEAYATSMVPVVALLDEAREEVLVEAYTLTSADVAAALARAADRGARVRVLLEGAPVGGVPADERALVATLHGRGAEVFALGGAGARYRTVHSKLVVVDRAAVSIATENLGEGDARGYGIVVRNATLAARFAEVVEADLAGHDLTTFEVADPPAEASARVGLPDERVRFEGAWNASIVLSPDHPEAIAHAIASARASVDVQMLRAEPDAPEVRALVEVARAGARVRLALDARFDDGTNRETIARLSAAAAREGLPLVARFYEGDRALHAKAIAIDGRFAYIGSMNWVRAAREDNREAGLLLEAPELALWLQKEMQEEGEGRGEGAEEVKEVPAPPWGLLCLVIVTLRGLRARAPCRAGRGRA